ncbi:MAG: HAD family hydrolase [Alphaproteobacteria bacterium]
MTDDKFLFVLDLDDTLALKDKPIEFESYRVLKFLEESGHGVAIISGKPTAYLAGICRQVGLSKAYISGENGVELALAHQYPTQFSKSLTSNKYKQLIEDINTAVTAKFPDKFNTQDNKYNFTAFPIDGDEDAKRQLISEISEFVKTEFSEALIKGKRKITIYEHRDAIDVVPIGVSKFNAMEEIAQHFYGTEEPISAAYGERVFVFGDSGNDLSMLRSVIPDNAYQIGNGIGDHYKFNIFDDVYTALVAAMKKAEIPNAFPPSMFTSLTTNEVESLLTEYQEVSADWRSRDQMTYLTFGWILVINGVNVPLLHSPLEFWQISMVLTILTILNTFALLKMIKDSFYKKGGELYLRYLEGVLGHDKNRLNGIKGYNSVLGHDKHNRDLVKMCSRSIIPSNYTGTTWPFKRYEIFWFKIRFLPLALEESFLKFSTIAVLKTIAMAFVIGMAVLTFSYLVKTFWCVNGWAPCYYEEYRKTEKKSFFSLEVLSNE